MSEPKIIVLREMCTGSRGSEACKFAHKLGRSVHMITEYDSWVPSLVMPTTHWVTVEDGIAAINDAWENAPMITTDAQLYEARALKIAHKLPVGWVDPTRR